MVRVVGKQNRSEFILDPAQALARARVLDRMLARAAIPVERAVARLKHREMNQLDDRRQLQAARRLNSR